MKNTWKKSKSSTKIILLVVVLFVVVCCFGLFVSSKELKTTNNLDFSLDLDSYADTIIENSLPKE